ncbi:MAG: hypothetical protein Q8M05_16050 [Rhodoferax sp.]|uniref:hypothetical protein n=1 Tax=Rhodoferax sp. TaxID=50421 RepID=UPI002731CAC4|nr:hypothetical protein [Rhodoferax sp.]MDP1530895.1 hypothetical protein [Rhodoferax sp.]MDP1942825.1 hypothetical protein [Rhodoferax sp.]
MSNHALMPRDPVPALNVALTTGERFVLGANPGEKFDLVVFYRGLHCPICAKYLIELERLTLPHAVCRCWRSAATTPSVAGKWPTRSTPRTSSSATA